jgi:FMN phosphatase YigB (HAD superfamily)
MHNMVIHAKWLGIDFGQTLMDPKRMRTYLVIGDTSKELGEPDLVEERCHKWRLMREKYGSWPAVRESHRPEALSFTFDNQPEVNDVYLGVEQKYLTLGDGAIDTISYLRDQGIHISVVCELKKTLGTVSTETELTFLRREDALKYFEEFISPQGKVNLRDGSIDLKYKGTSKETGTLYDVLIKDLASRGIEPSDAVVVGDKEWSDITPAKKRGFKTILYTGCVCRGPTEADIAIRRFSELKEILRFKNE